MNYHAIFSFLFILSCVTACEPGSIDDGLLDEATDGTDETESGNEPDMAPCSTDAGGRPVVPDGEVWGACPTDPTTGLPHLCNEGIACVPTEFGNLCLPVGECPESPGFGTELEMGWGDLCYPRCVYDSDCAPGMLCDVSQTNETMCAWPLD
jgi:hypothetical protein